MSTGLRVDVDLPVGGFEATAREIDALAIQLAQDASDRASRQLLRTLREDMAGANLGRLGNALGQTSDKTKGTVFKRGDIIRASGLVFIRSKSPRTVGAIISYTEGAEILPVKGRWLWIPTDEVQRIVGSGKERARMTPALYKARGFEQKFGPLILIRSINGNPLLAVQNVGVSGVGARGGRVRGLTKGGRPRKGDRLKELAVLFVGIPRTSRAARVDPRLRAQEAATQVTAQLQGV